MRRLSIGIRRQHGAIAIMFALSVFFLIGFMGLALDISQTYDRKTELQNAADAAALAGAKELKGTAAGIDLAVTKAQAIAAAHKFKFGTSVALAAAAITFGDSPDLADASWLSISAAKANPSAIFFIKIDTNGADANYGRVNTNFMAVLSSALATTNTSGRAVAGRFALSVAPLGVCALNNNAQQALPHPGLPDELMEFGYRRGMSYDIINVDPLGASANKYLLDPLDIATGPNDNGCTPSNNNTPTIQPFLCSGTSNIITSLPGYVFANTGMQAALNAEFNARFNTGGSCTVPPDANIKQYPANVPPGSGTPSDWMTPAPTGQSVKLVGSTPFYLTATPAPPAATANDWGVLWSYNSAVQYASPNTPYTTANWPLLYPTTPVPTPSANSYPAPSPYGQSGGTFYQKGAGSRDRRVLQVAVIDCNSLQKNGKCSTLKVLGVGKFFMSVPSNVPQHLDAEFAGLISEAQLTTEIKLYK